MRLRNCYSRSCERCVCSQRHSTNASLATASYDSAELEFRRYLSSNAKSFIICRAARTTLVDSSTTNPTPPNLTEGRIVRAFLELSSLLPADLLSLFP